MKIFKYGFTLAELLIALIIVAILVAILFPMIRKIMPDENALMAKRAYYTVQTVVSNIIKDEDCYPDMSHSANPRIGFDDGYGYINCEFWGGDDETKEYIRTEDAPKKFATLFLRKLDLKSPIEYNNISIEENSDFGCLHKTNTDDDDDNCNGDLTITTKDGMQWTFSHEYNLEAGEEDGFFTIGIDVNGKKGPNCAQPAVSGKGGSDYGSWVGRCSNRTDGWDQFSVDVKADGSIEIQDNWAKDAVDTKKDVSGGN